MPPAIFPDLALTILAIDLLRYLLGAGGVWLIVNRVLRRPLAARRILDATPRPGQVRHELAYSISTVAIFAASGLMLWLLAANGWVRVYDDGARHGWTWWWASLALIVVTHDAWFYWTHRLLHHKRWFGAVHGRHHASTHPTPWAAYSFHPIEAALQAAFLPLFVALVPIHTAAIGVFLIHMMLRNAVGHCSHELLPWAWASRGPLRWITPVTHHHFHHARKRGNFGLYFTWWDRWCGTEDADYLRYGDAHFIASAKAGGKA
jgi:sterol desaturase/sphingolipid hydroxylase (fatty acid hydroxylase superfamily)